MNHILRDGVGGTRQGRGVIISCAASSMPCDGTVARVRVVRSGSRVCGCVQIYSQRCTIDRHMRWAALAQHLGRSCALRDSNEKAAASPSTY